MIIRGRAMPVATYRARRRRAAELLEAAFFGPVPLLLLGCNEHRLRAERQDPWFDYYSGCHEPDAALLLLPDGTATLFLDPGDPKRVIWDGPRLGAGAAARRAFATEHVAPCERLDAAVRAAARAAGGRIALCHRNVEPGFQAAAHDDWKRRLAGEARVVNAEAALRRQRMIKEAGEVAWHRRAIAITRAGLLDALRNLSSFRSECELASYLTMRYRAPAYGPLAFPPIVGGAVNGATLHYPFNDQPLPRRGALLIDSGATAGGYCADVTRTVPVHGRFDAAAFRKAYALCLKANALARKAARPGVTLKQLNEAAWKPILDAGYERHHGVSHHIGLDVHDPSDREAPLAPGMIISNEPGIYLPDEGFGIRIEDDLLITADGCEELTRSIPKGIDEISALLG